MPSFERLCHSATRVVSLSLLIGIVSNIGFCVAAERSTTLTLAGVGYDAAERMASEGLPEFTRKSGLQIRFTPLLGNSAEQLSLIQRTLGQHYSTPDIYLIDIVWPGALQANLLDLKPYADRDTSEHLPELLANDTVAGRLVALPFQLNVGMMFYRTDLLAKYGFRRPPATWSELERMAAKIQKGERRNGNADFWGYVWQGADYEGLTCNALEWGASFGGGKVIERDGTISVNNPQTAKAMRTAMNWIGSISPSSILSYNEADSLNVFRSGNAAFMRYWTSGYHRSAEADSPIRGRFDVTLMPAGPHGRAQTVGGFQLAVSKYSKHPREAAKLIVFLSGSVFQRRRAIEEGLLPTMPKLFADSELAASVPEAVVAKRAGRDSWVTRPSTISATHYSAVSNAYHRTVHRILSRQIQPEQGLIGLEKELLDLKIPSTHRR